MCGIAGVIGRDPDAVRSALDRLTRGQCHRGPDDQGAEVYPFGPGWLGLGHRRLSILDVSPLGHQPMSHGPTGCRITYNGEVYNFHRLRRELEAEGDRFHSGSDTEVILAGLARHGPGFIRRLEGMYAFGLFDPRAGTLLLARDPAGIKPLYVARTADALVFASEVRAVLATGLVPRTASPAGLASLLAYGSLAQPLTLFETVRMAGPGAWQTIRATPGGWAADPPVVWWTPPPPEPAPPAALVVSRTRELLDAAVRDHLVSDVPVGVFLSAGLDSATIAGLAARHRPDLRTFTVGFGDQPDPDEVATAARTARRFRLPHTPIRLPMDAAEEAALDWLSAADQPSMDGLNTFVIARAVRAQGIKVALSGLGADELFGGYPSFREVPRLRRLAWAAARLPGAARRAVAAVLTAGRGAGARAKLADMLAGAGDIASLALQRRRLLSDGQMAALGLNAPALGLSADWLPRAAADILPGGDDVGWAVSVIESRFYQTNVLLRDSDANGMAHGLEIRVPFLDQRLLDWGHRLSGPVRFPTNQPPKALLRNAVPDLLDTDVLSRPKTGFALPLARWMVGPLRSMCEDRLGVVKDFGLVRPAGADAVWRSFASRPDSPAWSRALTLVALGDYLKRHAA
jgi:asparagine synthase (glutamine-hydrolysing)